MILKVKDENGQFKEVILKGLRGEKGERGERGEDGTVLQQKEIDDIKSSLDNLESEVNELKEGNIDIDLTNYVTKSELSSKADKTELHSHSNKDVLDGITTNKITEWDAKSNLSLGETSSTAYQGDRGKIAYDHSQAAHAPITAQKNSDILKSEIESKLVGTITSHSHNTVNGFSFWFGTQSQYDAIATKSNTTIYMINEG